MAPRHVLAPLAAALVVSSTGAASAFAATGGTSHAGRASATSAQTAKAHRSKRMRALQWAYTQRGKPYQWGGTGPGGYDCSGLVYAAYRHAGITLGRTTSQMLGSRRLYRVSQPLAGDLAFYGPGHVELYVRRGVSFGALDAGTRLWWHHFSQWWHPTMYYRVRGASS